MRKKTRMLAMSAAGIALLLTLAACGGDGNGTTNGNGDGNGNGNGAGGSLTFEASEYEFAPSSATVGSGDVTIVLTNVGVVEHDVKIDGSAHVHADPGQTSQGTFPLAAGTYTFYCSIPGHQQLGMEGTLTVG